MTITLEEVQARKAVMKQARRERERANRVWTNVKPHVHIAIDDMAKDMKVSKASMVRILLLEAMEARGVNIDKVFREWKAEQNAGGE
jgi:hypothetical protein